MQVLYFEPDYEIRSTFREWFNCVFPRHVIEPVDNIVSFDDLLNEQSFNYYILDSYIPDIPPDLPGDFYSEYLKELGITGKTMYKYEMGPFPLVGLAYFDIVMRKKLTGDQLLHTALDIRFDGNRFRRLVPAELYEPATLLAISDRDYEDTLFRFMRSLRQ